MTTITIDHVSLEKSNKAFHKMSKKQQRIAIAKDILIQIKKKTYVGYQGAYIRGLHSDLDSTELQECLLTDAPECRVCGLGSAFLSLSRLGNKVEIPDDTGSRDYYCTLDPIFGKKQRELIEATFEGWSLNSRYVDDHSAADYRHIKFHNKYLDDTERLAAIFRNVVKNDGTFKP
jgi:hypothetical protein